MCGRYNLSRPEWIFDKYKIPKTEQIKVEPNYNITPGQKLPVVLRDSKGNHLRQIKWGISHSWSGDNNTNAGIINARVETLAIKPSFKKLLIKQRCLVPATGYYEWQKMGDKKIPFNIHSKTVPLFSFAGLYDVRKKANGELTPSFTIITKEADKVVSKIHNRMPVVLDPKGEEIWLDYKNRDKDKLINILQSSKLSETEIYPVSSDVSKAGNNYPELIKRAKDSKI